VLIAQLHNTLATTVILFMLVCGLWGLFGALTGGLSASLAGALMIGEGLIVVQGLLGAFAYLTGPRPARALHYLYGLAAVVTLPGIYTYARGRPARQQALLMGLGALFIMGLAIRGVDTARLLR
jgi:hypothetical protein